MIGTVRFALCIALCTGGVARGAELLQQPDSAVFHSGTRLVEVEVVVRDQPVRPPGIGSFFSWTLDSGPPFGPPGTLRKGLTKDDFTLLDNGKPQPITVLRVGASSDAKPLPKPPGAVSNREDSAGQPLNGATVVLIDQLNTEFDTTDYARLGIIKLLRSLGQSGGRVAVYTLGERLHILHDFNEDPSTLTDLAAKLDRPHGQLPPDLASALRDYGDLMDLGKEQVHGQMTANAVKLIAQHLSGVPGRKNLIWMFDEPNNAPPPLVASLSITIARQSNIIVYPVVIRTVTCATCPHLELDREHYTRQLAAATGGRAFFDAMDLPFAVQAAEEDSRTAYVLGYYPDEEMLDGKYHTITVKLRDKTGIPKAAELNYRPGYLATKSAVPPPAPTPRELFEGPVNSAGIGLVAQAVPDTAHPGLYDLRVTVDLHDIHLERKDGHFIGAFDVSVPNPSAKGTVNTATVSIDLTDAQVDAALENGGAVTLSGLQAQAGELRVVVRDRSTGTAGSLRIPIETRGGQGK
ncbi:MAG TPA: VWA domain-containing protein [Bryobacteraceae bacterium]|jgi:VWFA-related protein